uniref:Alternative protein PITPNM2 n=1 Tax=Homo sapiens TaxID=9606 RepID=L8EB28_HUMAN|nr:alternative protein PITPNM2 [Homo sapiens]
MRAQMMSSSMRTRTCPTQRKCSPRTSPSGAPMTSWTRSRAQSRKTHKMVCTARVPLSSGWPPVWSS